MRKLEKYSRLYLISLLIFFVGLIIGKHHHELWFDEIQSWQIASYSTNIFRQIPYDGHPPFWYLLQLGASSFLSLQQFHFLHTIFTVTSVLLFYKITRTTHLAVLFLMNYYILFEYGIITRHYSPSICLFLFIIYKILFKKPNSKFTLTETALHSFLFLVTPFSFFIGIIFVLINIKSYGKSLYPILLLSFALFIAFYMIPPANITIYRQNNFSISFDLASFQVFNFINSFFLITKIFTASLVLNFVNNFKEIVVITGILFAYLTTLFFKRNKVVCCSYIGCQVILFLFMYTKNIGTESRHHGHYFIVFIIHIIFFLKKQAWRNFDKKLYYSFITLLTIHSIVGISTYIKDIRNNFSSTKEIAKQIKNQSIRHIYCDDYRITVSLRYHLPKNYVVYHLGTMTEEYFADYEKNYFNQYKYIPEKNTLSIWSDIKKSEITSPALVISKVNTHTSKFFYKSSMAIEESEGNLFIYKI